MMPFIIIFFVQEKWDFGKINRQYKDCPFLIYKETTVSSEWPANKMLLCVKYIYAVPIFTPQYSTKIKLTL